MGKHIGLDIGIASVGWSVIEDDYSVIELGSNIFNSCEASNNQTRREMRQARRLLRRKKTRIKDFNKLWKKHFHEIPEKTNKEVIFLKNKGLNEKLLKDEIYFVLLNYLKHRGISYLDDIEEIDSNSEYNKGLLNNQLELETKFPCQIQLERMNRVGKYRGITCEVNDDSSIININIFTNSSYKKEITQIIETQKKFNDFLNNDFIVEYMKIFERKREYFIGPGNEKSRTDYGIYTTKKNIDGSFKTDKNLFEKLIGKCSIYNGENGKLDEFRAPMSSYTAEEFNLLNDLNNLTIEGKKLTKEEVIKIMEFTKSEEKKPTESDERNLIPKIIEKVTNKKKESIRGARINSDNEQIFHNFKFYRTLKYFLSEKNIKIDDLFTHEDIDDIAYILTINTSKEQIYKEIGKKDTLSVTDDIKELLINIRKNNTKLFSKWHNFSIKLMKEIVPIMYETGDEQMTILTHYNYMQSNIEKYKQCKKFPIDDILEDIYNPVVRRSIRITLKILNALLQKYDDINEISIEMPRDKNEKDENQRKGLINKNEKELPNIIKKINDEYGLNITLEQILKIKSMPLKLKLWDEQNGICVYSGKKINPLDLIEKNRNNFEIDHIIPLSISFDDSRMNKVLVYSIENQNKGQKTPYMYFNTLTRDFGFKEFKMLVNNIYKGAAFRKKRENFFNMEDITKIDVLKGFIQRNINDTRYASKIVLNACTEFFAAHDRKIKVKVIRGSFTHNMRKNLHLDKDRDKSFAHHAIDACLICYSHMGYDEYETMRKNNIIDIETGEIINEEALNKGIDSKTYEHIIYQDKWKLISDNLKEAEKRVKYWHKVDKKNDRGLLKKVTIYGTRKVNNNIYKVDTLKLHELKEGKEAKNLILNNKEKLLMYKHDLKTFNILLNICKTYSDAENPFLQYEKETGEKIRKYAKNHKGAIIDKIRYLSTKVESCFDISHKYGFENGDKKVIQLEENRYRADVYLDNKNDRYVFVGIKYSDMYKKGNKQYINTKKYLKVLENNNIHYNSIESLLNDKNFVFKFSLYNNDEIEFENLGKITRGRFSSANPEKNQIEYKPIEAKCFEDIGFKRQRPSMNKVKNVRKIVKDIIGEEYYVNNEKFNGIFD